MRFLIGCEFSGVVRDAFIARGHDAYSCDLRDTVRPGPHIKGDVRKYLREGWDGLIVFAPCTYLCRAGQRWLKSDPSRWAKMEAACDFFLDLYNAPIPKFSGENPAMHNHARKRIGIEVTQWIQPWQFGHEATKRTGLWLRNLPILVPTRIMTRRIARCHNEGPGPFRAQRRSWTCQGIADAMAEQWG